MEFEKKARSQLTGALRAIADRARRWLPLAQGRGGAPFEAPSDRTPAAGGDAGAQVTEEGRLGVAAGFYGLEATSVWVRGDGLNGQCNDRKE